MTLFKKILANLLLAVNSLMIIYQGVLLGDVIDTLYHLEASQLKQELILMALSIGIGAVSGIGAWNIIHDLTGMKMKRLKLAIFHFDLRADEKPELTDYNTNLDMIYSKNMAANWNMMSVLYLMIFAIIAMCRINVIMMIIGIIVSMLPLCVPKFAGEFVKRAVTSFAKENQRYQEYVSEHLNGKEEIKQYQVTKKVEEEHEEMATSVEDSRKKAKRISSATNIVSSMLASLSFFLIILCGGILAINGLITAGNVITMIELMNYTVEPMVKISELLKEKKGCADIMNKFIQKEKDGKALPDDAVSIEYKPVEVCMEDVSFTYDGENKKEILHGFNYRFHAGRKYLVCGSSGAGKTTLGRLIAGELRPDTGRIYIDGNTKEDIDRNVYNYIRKVNQDNRVYSMSLRDNIRFYREISDSQTDVLMKEFNLNGLEDNKEDIHSLSGGEKERISIARAFVDVPGFVIFDEPTSSLDIDNAKNVMSQICALKSTVLCISHTESDEIKSMFDEIITL